MCAFCTERAAGGNIVAIGMHLAPTFSHKSINQMKITELGYMRWSDMHVERVFQT